MILLRRLVPMVGTALALATTASAETTLESAKFKFEVKLEQLDKTAAEGLDAGYREKLAKLREIYQRAGNLDAILEIKAATAALNSGEPMPAATLPRLQKLNEEFASTKREREKEVRGVRRKLFAAYVVQLEAMKEKGSPDGDAIDEAIAAAKETVEELKYADALTPGSIIRGRMHIDIDDKVTIYVNGEKWQAFMRYPKNRGKIVTPVRDLTIGDRFLASTRNTRGGFRHLKMVFLSEDGKVAIDFRVADLTDLKAVIGDRRDFTLDELSSDAAIPAVPAILDAKKSRKTFDFENRSEWMWGKDDHALLGTVIKPEMCRVR